MVEFYDGDRKITTAPELLRTKGRLRPASPFRKRISPRDLALSRALEISLPTDDSSIFVGSTSLFDLIPRRSTPGRGRCRDSRGATLPVNREWLMATRTEPACPTIDVEESPSASRLRYDPKALTARNPN